MNGYEGLTNAPKQPEKSPAAVAYEQFNVDLNDDNAVVDKIRTCNNAEDATTLRKLWDEWQERKPKTSE